MQLLQKLLIMIGFCPSSSECRKRFESSVLLHHHEQAEYSTSLWINFPKKTDLTLLLEKLKLDGIPIQSELNLFKSNLIVNQ